MWTRQVPETHHNLPALVLGEPQPAPRVVQVAAKLAVLFVKVGKNGELLLELAVAGADLLVAVLDGRLLGLEQDSERLGVAHGVVPRAVGLDRAVLV